MQFKTIRETGVKLSPLGLGTVPLAGFGHETTYEQFEQVILAAYEFGYRYFDTAPMYGSGRAEMFLGQVLRTNGLRDKVTLSTKIGRLLRRKSATVQQEKFLYGGGIVWHGGFPFVQSFDYSYDGIMRSVEDSFQRFGLDSFDITHIHDIGRVTHGDEQNAAYWKQLETGGFRALDELRSAGAVRAVGIGVNETEAVMDVAGAFDLDCCLLAGRYSLLNHAPLEGFFPEMQRRNIAVIAAGVFNSGILGGGTRGATKTFDYMDAPKEILDKVDRIEAICQRHGVALPEAAIQFVSAHPAVACVLQGCKNEAEVRQNAAAFNKQTPSALWDELREAGLIPVAAPLPVAA